jgi:hypothetical protein
MRASELHRSLADLGASRGRRSDGDLSLRFLGIIAGSIHFSLTLGDYIVPPLSAIRG